MDAAYLRAANPPPFTVLSKRLKRFSLGHEILFQRFDNRFSIENDAAKNPPQIQDLLTGVFICSQPYSQDVSLDQFSIPLRARIYAKWLGPSYLGRALELFKDYIAAHTEIPDFYTKGDENAEDIGTPTIQAVKVSLMSRLGMSTDEALNVSFSLAFWDHFSWAEAQGHIQIIDDAERKRQEEILKAATAMADKIEAIRLRLFPDGYTPNAGRVHA